MASFMVISSVAVSDPCPALMAVPFTKASPLPSGMMRISQTPRIVFRATRLRLKSSSIAAVNASRTYKQCMPVCLFGGKGQSEGDSEASPWKALEKAMGNFKNESSVEDVLRKQIEKQEYFDDGGSGGNPPSGGGGDSGGSEDEGLSGIMDEAVQVFLATVAFILLYIYLLDGEEMVRLARDYIKYLFGGQKSIRLQRAMSNWRRFLKRFSTKKEVQKDWLEQAIISTPTWWDDPAKYRRLRRSYLASSSSSSSYDASSPYDASSTYDASSPYDDDDASSPYDA